MDHDNQDDFSSKQRLKPKLIFLLPVYIDLLIPLHSAMPIPDIESTPAKTSTSNSSYTVTVPQTCKVHFTKSSLTATWDAKDRLSLLQFAEKQGLKPNHGCRSGMCGTCETRLIKGQTEGGVGDSDGRTALDGSGTETWILICCSVPTSNEIWLEK